MIFFNRLMKKRLNAGPEEGIATVATKMVSGKWEGNGRGTYW